MSSNAAREVAARLREIRKLAESEAPLAAVRALSQAGETAVKVTLTSSTHREGTPTPSAPGQPPSLISGNLRRSGHRTTARVTSPGWARCALGFMAVYAPVHEFGPVIIRSKGNYPLRNRKTGQVFGQQVTIPRRPYVFPAMKRYQESGMARRVAEDAWKAALRL